MTDQPLDTTIEDPALVDDPESDEGEPDLIVPDVYSDPVPEE